MSQASDPNIWEMLFEQTPPVLRWLLGLLTLGLFTVSRWMYQRDRASVKRIENQLHQRIDRMEEETAKAFSELRTDINGRLDAINGHLIAIAKNTATRDS